MLVGIALGAIDAAEITYISRFNMDRDRAGQGMWQTKTVTESNFPVVFYFSKAASK